MWKGRPAPTSGPGNGRAVRGVGGKRAGCGSRSAQACPAALLLSLTALLTALLSLLPALLGGDCAQEFGLHDARDHPEGWRSAPSRPPAVYPARPHLSRLRTREPTWTRLLVWPSTRPLSPPRVVMRSSSR